VPAIVQGGLNPVIPVPGLTPTSPVTTDEPVQVTVEAPSTAKLDAAPNDGIAVVVSACFSVAFALPDSPQAATAMSRKAVAVLVKLNAQVDFDWAFMIGSLGLLFF
jgi:hypothetical protein